MVLNYLAIMSGSAVLLTFGIIFLLFRKKKFREILKYVTIGFFVAFLDIIVEYLGTTTHHWVYHESIYFLFNFIPVELFFLFFSAGVLLRFIFLNINKIKMPIKSNAIFYILILLTALEYVREIYQNTNPSMLPLAVLIGLWGVLNIPERDREGSLILALIAAGADWLSETVIISSGSYGYSGGFSLHIPIIYGLFTLGLLAVIGKLHKLDNFLDSPIISNLLKLFGVYRDKYTKKIVKAKDLVADKIRDKTTDLIRRTNKVFDKR